MKGGFIYKFIIKKTAEGACLSTIMSKNFLKPSLSSYKQSEVHSIINGSLLNKEGIMNKYPLANLHCSVVDT